MKFHSTIKNFSDQVYDSWNKVVSVELTAPSVPNKKQLRYLIEIAYMASMETEERRLINFTLCCSEKNALVKRSSKDEILQSWSFVKNRPYNIQELRRLSVATDTDTSAIWVEYDKSTN